MFGFISALKLLMNKFTKRRLDWQMPPLAENQCGKFTSSQKLSFEITEPLAQS